MLIGEFIHKIDNKKRLSVPSRFRKELERGGIITRGLDNCLFLFPKEEWQKLVEKLNTLSMGRQDTRSFVRLLMSGAMEVEFDNLGRILIPDYLKKYAELKKKVVVAGVLNRLEIWDEEKWQIYKIEAERNTDQIADKLGEVGLI